MSVYEWIGFGLVLSVGMGVVSVFTNRPVFKHLSRLIALGLLFRVIGSLARYQVIFDFYHGLGDAAGYYHEGLELARRIWSFDFSFVGEMAGLRGSLWGTPFLRVFSGFVLSLIGPTVRGEFLMFSLFAYVGLLLTGIAFSRSRPEVPVGPYVVWLCFWPSLWFWPSSVGKEALIVLATGLVVYGYVGRDQRPKPLPLILGLAVATSVRPHFGAVLAVSLAAAYWLTRGRKWTLGTLVQAVLSAGLAVMLMGQALTQLGVGDADLEGVREFVEFRSRLTEVGGSSIEAAGGHGLLSIPLALVNILLRPFPWEAHNVFALVSALEISFFWFVAWRRRQELKLCLRYWRSDRLLRFAVPFTLLYVVMIGLTFGNLGIISRQRVVVFPFLFLLLESAPLERRGGALVGQLAGGAREAPSRHAAPAADRPRPREQA
jgi:hypothetical protein